VPNYSAKLLFQFTRATRAATKRRVLCEERIVAFKARNATAALARAKRLGRAAEHRYFAADRQSVSFQFLGVMELLDLVAADSGEVWYELIERVEPERRRARFVPPARTLQAFSDSRPRKHLRV